MAADKCEMDQLSNFTTLNYVSGEEKKGFYCRCYTVNGYKYCNFVVTKDDFIAQGIERFLLLCWILAFLQQFLLGNLINFDQVR